MAEEVEARWHAGTGSRLREIGLIFSAVAKRVCSGVEKGVDAIATGKSWPFPTDAGQRDATIACHNGVCHYIMALRPWTSDFDKESE